jgi:hypothetical protein
MQHVAAQSMVRRSETGDNMAYFNSDDPEAQNKMRDMFGPGQVDQQIRQALQFCWMMLPDDRKNIDELEKQIRRILDRALKDFREDTDAFSLTQ